MIIDGGNVSIFYEDGRKKVIFILEEIMDIIIYCLYFN